MKSMIFGLAALTALSAGGCAAAEWTAVISDGGLRSARTQGTLRIGELEGDAFLQLDCRPGSDGSVAWRLEIDHPERYVNFGLLEFEGPDAQTLGKRLTTLGLQGAGIKFTASAAVNGFYGVDGGRFILEFSAAANESSQAALVADAVSGLTTAIAWTTHSPIDSGLVLQAEFDTTTVGSALHDTMQGCGPVPELTREQLSQWESRTPTESQLWSQRAVLWRLSGLLGRDWPVLLERMQAAEPLQHDGDVFFITGHRTGHDDEAAVVMFDTHSGAYDVVLIAAQKSSRQSSNPKAIDAPNAVREFIAERIAPRF